MKEVRGTSTNPHGLNSNQTLFALELMMKLLLLALLKSLFVLGVRSALEDWAAVTSQWAFVVNAPLAGKMFTYSI